MMEISKFDVADYLDSEEAIAEFLSAAIADENPDVFLSALAAVAKARGIGRIAELSGLGRESLYKALTPGAHPRYETVRRVVDALGVHLSVAAE